MFIVLLVAIPQILVYILYLQIIHYNLECDFATLEVPGSHGWLVAAAFQLWFLRTLKAKDPYQGHSLYKYYRDSYKALTRIYNYFSK